MVLLALLSPVLTAQPKLLALVLFHGAAVFAEVPAPRDEARQTPLHKFITWVKKRFIRRGAKKNFDPPGRP